MRLKHYLFLITLFCAFAEIAMAVYATHWGEILRDISFAEKRMPDSEMLIIKALNFALPLGCFCLLLLLYIWRVDKIGEFAILFAVVLHMIGFDLNVRAVKKFYGEGIPLANVTWWAPAEDNHSANLSGGAS